MSSEPIITIDLRGIENKAKAIRALEEMMKSDGWKLYATWLDGQRRLNIDAMTASDVGSDQLHKLSGQTRFLNVALNWPKLTHDTLVKQLDLEQKKGK